jgi:hypothetical protein
LSAGAAAGAGFVGADGGPGDAGFAAEEGAVYLRTGAR